MESLKWENIFLKELEEFMLTAPAISLVHKTDHAFRVWKICEKIGKKTGADFEVLCAAALLHDLGRHYGLEIHGEKSAELAEPILKKHNFPEEKIPIVLDAIAKHDYNMSKRKRKTIESKILYDSDKIDAFGAVGVYRHILFTIQGRIRISGVVPKLKERYRGLSLPESKKAAKKDYEYTVDYFKKLTKELKKNKP
ncbi:MAG: HD domain-containing protein [Candidatus Altiarchaeota archaeon]|nr:HD domain-containing protein [Candidatus Altiarchaeota archaeon]